MLNTNLIDSNHPGLSEVFKKAESEQLKRMSKADAQLKRECKLEIQKQMSMLWDRLNEREKEGERKDYLITDRLSIIQMLTEVLFENI